MKTAYEKLFKHFKFVDALEMKNRLAMGPILTYASRENGEISDIDMSFYEKRVGGVSTVIIGPAFITENGQVAHGQIGIHRDQVIRKLHQLTQMIHRRGAKAILQLSHGGRKCVEMENKWQAISPSEKPHKRKGKKPVQMTERDITYIVQAFGEATTRAMEAGFDGVEIDGGNECLLQQFISRQANERSDSYGGSAENRFTFALEVIREVTRRAAHAGKPFIVGYTLAPKEKGYLGNKVKDTFEWIDRLVYTEIDYLHISALHEPTSKREENRSLLSSIIKHVNHRVPLVGTGGLTATEVAEAFEQGLALITIEQALVVQPDWVEKVINSDEPGSMDGTSLDKDVSLPPEVLAHWQDMHKNDRPY
ncbi:NADH-dependent flavin oxidoreductase [Priestia megaterium]|uniref:oxidoreductase n=1 Tax=Priestia megaterium TaxID=1404 RepID=UPI003A88B313